jgi:hypothetical protein
MGRRPFAVAPPLKTAALRADQCHMRHFRLWLLVIGVVSLAAEAVAAAAVFWRGSSPVRRPDGF